jgi:mannose-6-phosphate isomerase-like protein (cupin superfamily)
MRAEVLMRAAYALALAISLAPSVYAQAPAAPPDPKLFTSGVDINAMIANAKASRRPDQPNFTQPIVRSSGYTANLEYRVAGLNANATVHERDAEMFYVIEGSGTAVTGGTLKEGQRTNAENLAGTGIEGGTRRRVTKGDFILVPENTPHWFGEIDGALVLMSIHLPRQR